MNNIEHALTSEDLMERGLRIGTGKSIVGSLTYERPAWAFDPRALRECTLGAFTYINGHVTSSLYRCHVGRYAQIGESTIIGPPEHPMDWFSSHPFAFTRPKYLPNLYRMPDVARLAPDDSNPASYVDTVPDRTYIGHEAYVGAGSFVKRGVRIGDGAVVGARSVVTRDVPPFAMVVGSPAKVVRLRFDEKIVERMLQLAWWLYDLAPFKNQVDFSRAEATLDFLEQRKAEGKLELLRPDTYRVTPRADGFAVEQLSKPLY